MKVNKQVEINRKGLKYRYENIDLNMEEVNNHRNQLIIQPGDKYIIPFSLISNNLVFNCGVDYPDAIDYIKGVKWTSVYTIGVSVAQLRERAELYSIIDKNCLDDVITELVPVPKGETW